MLKTASMRVALFVFTVSLSATTYALADAPEQYVDIPAGDLSNALLTLSHRYGADLVYRPDQVRGMQTRGVHGQFTTEEAVGHLLEGTALKLSTGANGAMLIAAPVSNTLSRSGSAQSTNSVNPVSSSNSSGGERASLQMPVRLEEIVVTAQKRVERLQDVPLPVTALSADTLVENNQVRLQDYSANIPGFEVTPAVQGITLLSIRGITTGIGTNPTVGVTVDDLPYGSSAQLGGGGAVPDIDPGELARVEVLRGPQGTLYGASSMGGLLKYVTLDPSTDHVSGHVEGGLSGVKNGDEPGYNVRGSVNLPLGDTWAMRASGFTRRDPGYIDNVADNADGVNKTDVYGGRLSFMWRPFDTFSVKLSALFQKSKADGSSDADVALGDLQQNRVPGSGWADRQVQAYSAIISAKLGVFDFTSLSGYNTNEFNTSLDAGFAYGGAVFPRFGVRSAGLQDDNRANKYNQEFRLSTTFVDRVDWLIGAFATYEDSHYTQQIAALDPTTGAHVGAYRTSYFPTTYREYAGFTDFTFHITQQFDVQLGARGSDLRQTYRQTQTGVGALPTGNVPTISSDANAFTYLLTPRYKFSRDMMLYARLASGYRAGGPNADAGPGTPSKYDPDKTKTYEIGMKADVLDEALTIDTSVYYIDWKDIQLTVLNPQTIRTYITNGSRAKSQGVELAVQSRPITGLTLGGWVAFGEAELTESLPKGSTIFGNSGSRLPYSSRFSGRFSADESFPLTAGMIGSLGGSVNYSSDRQSVFTSTAVRQDLPAYARVDLHAGVGMGTWSSNLFATNITDRRGALYGGIGSFPPTAFTYIQPRTIGLSVERKF
jgi:outer membrane receptor protein involved in Fe transport